MKPEIDENYTNLGEAQTRLKIWLFDKCLPIWFEKGADYSNGGFYERLNQDFSPDNINRRTRVAARQVYSYSLAKQMGYRGETALAVKQGINWLHGPAMGKTGYLYAILAPNGTVVRAEFELYDHAFYLLGLAQAFACDNSNLELITRAQTMRDKIISDYWRNEDCGFNEAIPKILPLKANPHMHMFEACLAWISAGGDENWCSLAKTIAELAFDKFFDGKTNAILEYFDDNWLPHEKIGARTIEPGHQFEWAWLFLRWFEICKDERYLAIAKKLIATGEGHGVDIGRGLAFMSHNDNFEPYDFTARLWSQTERIKAHARLALISADPECRAQSVKMALIALNGLELYLATKHQGLYFDRIDETGKILVESSPASSLYHIICAIDEFCKL